MERLLYKRECSRISFAMLRSKYIPYSSVVAKVHDRMPVILDHKGVDVWLDPTVMDKDQLQELLKNVSWRIDDLIPVSTAVGNVKNTGSDLRKYL